MCESIPTSERTRGEEEGGEDWEREEGKLTVIVLKTQLSTSTINTKGIKITYIHPHVHVDIKYTCTLDIMYTCTLDITYTSTCTYYVYMYIIMYHIHMYM